jgi:hypothetical protein
MIRVELAARHRRVLMASHTLEKVQFDAGVGHPGQRRVAAAGRELRLRAALGALAAPHDDTLQAPCQRRHPGRHRRRRSRPSRSTRRSSSELTSEPSGPTSSRRLPAAYVPEPASTAMLGEEELVGHFGPHLGPICSRQRRVRRKAGSRTGCRDAFGHLEPERADNTIDDLERHTQTDNILEVTWSEVRSFQPLLAELGQRVQAAAEQRSHLLGSHRVAGGQAVDPVQPGADPHPRRLTPFGTCRRCGQADPSYFRGCMGCVAQRILKSGGRYAKRSEGSTVTAQLVVDGLGL